MSPRSLLQIACATTAFITGGCLTVGGGHTEREWNAAIAALAPGQTQAHLLRAMGEPRERLAAEPGATYSETWIYSRPERDGMRMTLVGEHDILLPEGKHTLSVPDYEDRDQMVIAEYHLRWSDGVLVEWERVVNRLPGR